MKKVKSNDLILKIPRVEAESIFNEQTRIGKKLLSISIDNIDQLKAVEKRYNNWNSENYELLKRILKQQDIARDYSAAPWSIGKILVGDLKLSEKVEKLQAKINRKLANLESIISSFELFEAVQDTDSDPSRKVFFVHGTNCDTKKRVLDFLLKLGLQPVVLKDLAAAGKTVIDEIQQRKDVKYAVTLLTPDDVGSVYNEKLNFRATQNVILELGIFIGNVSSLYTESVELPADYHEFQHIQIDKTSQWQDALRTELETAGFEFETE